MTEGDGDEEREGDRGTSLGGSRGARAGEEGGSSGDGGGDVDGGTDGARKGGGGGSHLGAWAESLSAFKCPPWLEVRSEVAWNAASFFWRTVRWVGRAFGPSSEKRSEKDVRRRYKEPQQDRHKSCHWRASATHLSVATGLTLRVSAATDTLLPSIPIPVPDSHAT